MLNNYPVIDGSTSAKPLNMIIACILLGIDYEWKNDYVDIGEFIFITGTKSVVPKVNDSTNQIINSIIKSSNTHNSFVNLINKEVDMTFSARKMSAYEKTLAQEAGVNLIETPIALDAFIFIINSDNPIGSLTTQQILDIYTGKTTNWNQIGNFNAEIKPYIREENSGSQELFELLVIKDIDISEFPINNHEVLFTMSGPLDQVMREANAICYTLYYYKENITDSGSYVKTLAVNGISPNKTTISDRTYPYISEVYAIIRDDLDKSSMAYKIYEWLQTPTGKEVITESNYVPN
jgi:phosphate transport system substrate-binding protein